jgi:CheY-like chemotaxis protein
VVIFYVDNDEDDLELFQHMLNKIDPTISLLEARDGVQALTLLADCELPDFIFLDINMPQMNGYETLVQLREIKALESTRIIMYSTTIHPKLYEKCWALNAMFLTKPNNIDDGVKLLKTALGLEC